jgi:hypothetical protein
VTRRDVAKLLAFATAAIPSVQITPATVEAWWAILGDLDADVAMAALRRVLAVQEIPALPAPGAIRKAAAELIRPRLPSPEEAWAMVLEAVRRHGYYDPPGVDWDFEHDAIRRAVAAIGWDTICLSEDIGVERAHFWRIYAAMAESVAEEARLPQGLRRGALYGGRGTEPIGDVLKRIAAGAHE